MKKSVLRFQCGAQSARASAGFLAQFCSRCWFTIPQLPQTAPKFKLLTAQSSQSVLRFWLLFPLRFISGIISSPKKELRPLKRKMRLQCIQNNLRSCKNRPFVMLCLASMLLIAFQFYYQSTYQYLLPIITTAQNYILW